jgi:hypothetical protein
MTGEMPEPKSEKFSEMPKRRRGRPRAFQAEVTEGLTQERFWALNGSLESNQTRRNHMNVMYRMKALSALIHGDDADRFAWLADQRKMAVGTPKSWRPSILSELGRIEDEEDMKSIAAQLCEAKPKARAAIVMIRAWRLGRTSPGSALDLANDLIGRVNDYMTRHPDLPMGDVVSAVETALQKVKEAASDE